jgi:hypothetical protein
VLPLAWRALNLGKPWCPSYTISSQTHRRTPSSPSVKPSPWLLSLKSHDTPSWLTSCSSTATSSTSHRAYRRRDPVTTTSTCCRIQRLSLYGHTTTPSCRRMSSSARWRLYSCRASFGSRHPCSLCRCSWCTRPMAHGVSASTIAPLTP